MLDFSLQNHIIDIEGGACMAQTVNVNFRMDTDLKQRMEQVCSEMGMSMTTAFTIFATKVCREKRIPFEINADPFYSESNMAHLRRGIAALNAGHGTEHDLIEDDD
jgi:DNA-damage-inducible protein J